AGSGAIGHPKLKRAWCHCCKDRARSEHSEIGGNETIFANPRREIRRRRGALRRAVTFPELSVHVEIQAALERADAAERRAGKSGSDVLHENGPGTGTVGSPQLLAQGGRARREEDDIV